MAESLRILILEDRPSDAELVQFELREAGLSFTAQVVMTKKEYVQALQEFSPDLILSDYDLPQYNGALALVEARRRCPDIPFILVTGAVGEDRAIEILTQGAQDYVLKNRLEQRLAPAVRRALAEAEEQKARKRAEEELREAHKSLERQVAERTAELQKQIEHRNRIEEALRKYNERLELLSYTASRLLASDKPQQIVEDICFKVMDFLDCHAFFNFLVDESAGRLHLNACAGIPAEKVREIEWLDYGVAVCGCAARDACRIVAENIPVTPDVRTELVKSFGIKAYACHPLLEQNRVLGTLSFGTRSRTTFSTDDLAIMKAVADQVTIAMVRVRTEDALRESEERYRELVQSSPDAVIVHREGQFLYANPAALRLYGAESLEKLQSRTVLDLVHLDDRPAIAARMEQGKAGQRLPLQETRLIRLNGQVVPVESVGGAVNYDGNPAMQVIIRDITDRKKAEVSLRERAEELATMLDAMPTPVIIVHDPDSHHMTGNRAADELLRHPRGAEISLSAPSEAKPNHFRAIKDGRELRLDELPAQRSAQGEQVRDFEFSLVFDDGITRHLLGYGTPLLDGQDRPRGAVHVLVDITARKHAEMELTERTRQLEDANRELESFSYSVSHDLRAPLRAIDGFSRKLVRDYGNKLDENFAHMLNVVRSNTELMGNLIDDLLSFSRVLKTGMSVSEIDMDKLARDVWNEIGAAHQERELEFRITNVLPGSGDRTLIRQVLFNLISNAVKFTRDRKPGIIEMSSYREPDKIVYCLKDNGVGFDMVYYDKLFGVFQRLHSSGEYEGTGVGLAIVQRIINRHGGRVWAEAKVNEGAAFSFTLPA